MKKTVKYSFSAEDFSRMMAEGNYLFTYREVKSYFCEGKSIEEVADKVGLTVDIVTDMLRNLCKYSTYCDDIEKSVLAKWDRGRAE